MVHSFGPFLLRLGLGVLAGAGLGFLYFGGLWLTLTRLPGSRRPRLFLGASVVLRFAAVLGAFYALLQTGGPALAAAMVGFLGARTVWLRAKGTVPVPRRQGGPPKSERGG